MNKTDNMYLPVWLKNILYIVGVCVIAAPFMLIKYFQINANSNSDIVVSFSFFDYIYSINSIVVVFILITPVIILDRVHNAKLLYSVGLNFDKFALRDIFIGGLISIVGISIILSIIVEIFAGLLVLYGTLGFIPGIFGICLSNLSDLAESKNSNFIDLIKALINSIIALANYIIPIFCIAFSEELLFRGYIFQNIYRKNGSGIAVIMSSLFFALAHFIGSDFEVIYFLNIFIAGILFCVMYIKTKSLWSSISFHFIWNIMLNILLKLEYSNNIEHHYICGIILLILIFVVLKLFRPSYRINKYYLINE